MKQIRSMNAFPFLVLASWFVGMVNSDCSTLATDLPACFSSSGVTYSTNPDAWSEYLTECGKADTVDTILNCWNEKLGACSDLQNNIGILPDNTALKAAIRGVCANSFVFQTGLTCLLAATNTITGVAASCSNAVTFAAAVAEVSQSVPSYNSYCSYMVTLATCITNGFTCDAEFEAMYLLYAKALLPPGCRDFANYTSTWISAYGHAPSQHSSLLPLFLVGVLTSIFVTFLK